MRVAMFTVAKIFVLSWVASALQLSDEDRKLICDDAKRPYPPHKEAAIRWLHMPKTGTSFANTVWHYGCNIDPNVSVADFDSRFEGNLNDKYPIADWCPKLVDHSPSTHKPVGNKEWADHKGNFVTMAREPSSRIMSAYFYGNHHCISDCNPENSETHLECDVIRDPLRGKSDRCNMLHESHCPSDYAAALPAQGCQTKMILGYPCASNVSLTQKDLDEAVDRVTSGFSFIGLVEEWDLSICMFHRVLGGEFYPVENAHVRPTGTSEVPEDCPKDEKVTDDMDKPVYDAAKASFEKHVQQVLAELKGEASSHASTNPLARMRDEAKKMGQAIRRHV